MASHKNKIIHTLIFSTLLLLSSCSGDDNENGKPLDNNLHNKYLSFNDSFNIEENNIGSSFKGHDFVEIGKELIEKKYILKLPIKDEFETSEQYSNRIAKYNPEEKLFSTTNSNHYFAFTPDEMRFNTIKYNADSEKLNILVKTTHYSLNKTNTTNEKDMSATNAFGVKINVKYTDEVKYSLDLHHDNFSKNLYNSLRKLSYNKRQLPYKAITPAWVYYDPDRNLSTKSSLDFSRVLKLPLEEAKKIKKDLRVLIITSLKSPYLKELSYEDEPTLDNPTAGKRTDIEIIADIEQIWLYNSITGDVIKKWPATETQENTTDTQKITTKAWTKDELMAHGNEVYSSACVACHQAGGEGIPNVFPALKGSPIATGDVITHINIVLHGNPGTAMMAFGQQLNDYDIAALVTYERNTWGNDTGDVVQPDDIKAERQN